MLSIRQLRWFLLLTVLWGCARKPVTTAKPAVSYAAEDRILFTQITPHFADSLILHASRVTFVEKVKKGWDKDLSFPHYSRTLANLTQWVSQYNGTPLTAHSLETLSTQWGITTPWIIQTYLRTTGANPQEQVTWVREQLAHYMETHHISHYGFYIKTMGKEQLTILFMQRRLLEFAPFPKWLEIGQPSVIFGKASMLLDSIEVIVHRPDNKIERRFVNMFPDGSFKLAMKFCEKKKYSGRYDADFIGYNREGPVALARFTVACEKKSWPKPDKPEFFRSSVPLTAEGFENQVMAKVNMYRRKMGFLPVHFHKGIHTATLSHAREMCKKLKLMHISPENGNPQERLKAAGVEKVLVVAENVATGDTPTSVMDAWIASADHRSNLQLPRVTHGAVGVCRRELVDKSVVYYAALMLMSFEPASAK
ncbi:CAP domain-containing protein [Myxococcota bacterium]|nr:CAP domain-containing protein [Myxococcota bacterium]